MARFGMPKKTTSSLSSKHKRDSRKIFVAYPFRLYAKNNADYRAVFTEIEKAYELKFIFADNEITTMHILEKIKSYIRDSQFGIYDISSWNPNVTLELGLSLGLDKRSFIIVDTSKHDERENVPADLGGMDRIQYSSFLDLKSALVRLISTELPAPISAPNPIKQMQDEAMKLFKNVKTSLSIGDIAEVLGVNPRLARLAIEPLIGEKLETSGEKRGTKYHRKPLPPGRPRKQRANKSISET